MEGRKETVEKTVTKTIQVEEVVKENVNVLTFNDEEITLLRAIAWDIGVSGLYPVPPEHRQFMDKLWDTIRDANMMGVRRS